MNKDDVIRIELVKPKQTTEDIWDEFLVYLGRTFFHGALLMLRFAAAHEIWPVIPPAGFVTCFMLNLGMLVVGGYLRVGQRGSRP